VSRFVLRAPTWPTAVERPPVERRTGPDFETDWARRYPARLARAALLDWVLRPAVRVLASPRVEGLDRIEALEAPAIFAANHHSHLDTPLLLALLPQPFRHRTVIAAAADYFFTTRARGTAAALSLNAIPVDSLRVSRRSADLAAGMLRDGWSLVIFPEGGRSPDGWGQEFRGGAAYLSVRCARPVVPVHIAGTNVILPKGATRPRPAHVTVTFGRPLTARDGEDARRFTARLEREVAALADEHGTDWWTARRRAAREASPVLTGPEAPSWRRTWSLEHKRRGPDRADRWPRAARSSR
jgi:1-acyl-sn-glycerol-3-phosphate acyltransferase